MIKSAVLAVVTAAAALAATSAHAGVRWSVGVNLPVPVGAVVSAPAYGYYAPGPVYAAPAPVYVAPPVVYGPGYYYARPAYYRPAPVVFAYGYRGWHRGWR